MMNPELETRLKQLMSVFLEENTKLNLSALRTEDACWTGNILDSLAFLELIDSHIIATPASVIDIGTGGGFPLLPLAIALPGARCVGVDSIGKKIEAIKRIVAALGLKNVTLIANRSEVTGREKQHRDAYDVVTSRAVAPLPILLEYCVPLAKVNGHIVLWKSTHIEEELKASEVAQAKLKCALEKSHQYDLGGDWGVRQLLIFRKLSPTPPLYPREVGMPKKEPL